MRAIIKRLGFFGYDKETKEYTPDGQLEKITREHQPGKTFWDWLQLLIIPIILAGATIALGLWQVHLADLQHQSDQKLAQQQHNADQLRALEQQQATILQTYIDNIQDLLLNHNLLKSTPFDDVAVLAKARTLTALQGLDSERKGSLLKFLYEAQLIGFQDNTGKHGAIIDLSGADLTNAALHDTDLIGVNLSKTDLYGALLYRTDLRSANLQGADLRSANLQGANLSNANLQGANLTGADLGCTKPGGEKIVCADLSNTDLRSANLQRAIVTSEQLAKAKSLKGATMPDGSTHP